MADRHVNEWHSGITLNGVSGRSKLAIHTYGRGWEFSVLAVCGYGSLQTLSGQDHPRQNSLFF